MVIKTIKSHFTRLELRSTGLLAITFFILFCCILISAKNYPSPVLIWLYITQLVGFTAYPLVPMAVFVLASLVILTFEPFEPGSSWVRALQCIEVIAPVLGILGTFVGIGIALKSLGTGSIIGEAITLMINQIGTCIWSTVVGMTVGIIAYILVENGVHREHTIGPESVNHHPVYRAMLLREKKLLAMLQRQEEQIKCLHQKENHPDKTFLNS